VRGKKDTLEEQTRLELNRRLLKNYAEWDDEAISQRASDLFDEARQIWPRPEPGSN
jgi:hypothetical protein